LLPYQISKSTTDNEEGSLLPNEKNNNSATRSNE
jgi:hypothetical protein